ncbi:MAG: hypothetical protein VB144_07940 [Clostridia bacterium]|nr:hypothetical protein [Clostridia bacterium]
MKRRLMLLRMVAVMLLAVMAGLGPAPAVRAAIPRADLPADVAAWLALMPELAAAPAPPWLKAGARLTYHIMSAAREGDTTPAGESLVQYDVVSSDGTSVLAVAGIHVISDGMLAPVRDTGFIVGAPGVGEVWMNPAALSAAERHANQHISIAHVPMNVGGATIKAVRFESAEGVSRNVSVFEEATGVLLYRIQALGNLDTAKQNTVISEFVSMRQINPAWAGGSTPAWAAVDAMFKYEGTTAVNVGQGSPAIPLPLAMLGQIVYAAPTYACVRWETYMSGRKTEERYSLSPAAIPSGGIFLPPQALAVLRAGQALDADPTTGVTISVAQSPLVMDGKQLLTLVHQGRSFQRLYGYDCQSGMLIYFGESAQQGLAMVQTELKLTGVYGR